MSPKNADGMANSIDPDQTAPQGLHCLPRPVCPKNLNRTITECAAGSGKNIRHQDSGKIWKIIALVC